MTFPPLSITRQSVILSKIKKKENMQKKVYEIHILYTLSFYSQKIEIF